MFRYEEKIELLPRKFEVSNEEKNFKLEYVSAKEF